MPEQDVVARLRLRDQRRFTKGLQEGSKDVRGIGKAARRSAADARALNKASRGLGLGIKSVGRWATYGGAALAGGLIYETKRSIDAFEQKRKIVAQTNAVLKSTGGLAGVTAKHVDGLANSVSRSSGMDDEAVRGAENLLLTFRDIRNEAGKNNDIFDQTTRVTADLSAAMGMDLNSAALQVGKALNDPARGFKRLQRIGVSFSKTQEDQIKHFTETGDRAGAQRVILGELTKEFGGSAKAQATAMDRLKVTVGNLEEAYGKALSPAIDGVAKQLDKFGLKALPLAEKAADDITKVFGRKDLTLGEKLTRAGHIGARDLHPVFQDIKREFRKLGLGDALGGAVERAAPHMADAMARQVPRMAKAFMHAFANAGPGGQLLTVALITAKLGGFSAAGGWAARTMSGRFGKRIGPELATSGIDGKMRAHGRGWGRAAAAGTAIGFGLSFGALLEEYLQEHGVIDDIANWLYDNLPGMPGGAPPGFETPKKATRSLRRSGKQVGRTIDQTGDPKNKPPIVLGEKPNSPASRHARRKWAHKQGARSRSNRQAHAHGASVRATGASVRETHIHVHVGSREVATAVDREVADQVARSGRRNP
jgi:acid phosphatase family membrane protein YuiD